MDYSNSHIDILKLIHSQLGQPETVPTLDEIFDAGIDVMLANAWCDDPDDVANASEEVLGDYIRRYFPNETTILNQ